MDREIRFQLLNKTIVLNDISFGSRTLFQDAEISISLSILPLLLPSRLPSRLPSGLPLRPHSHLSPHPFLRPL